MMPDMLEVNDRALYPAKGRTVAWFQQDGDGITLMSSRVWQEMFEIPRVPISAFKKYGTEFDEIIEKIEVVEGVTVEAAEWPDGTMGVMFYKGATR